MSRFVQEDHKGKPAKEEKKDKPIKAGNKDYDYNNLGAGKKIPTQGGWR